ncbi:MAG TPA: efflux transporter outer membrane subunit [Opitutaceae bacterium]|jgi:NodT family efflux transporter outer membrane factor (OMF) lipoprotein|nr:efflux transporter outer membrane subunit [Opitutaceae bacterium]
MKATIPFGGLLAGAVLAGCAVGPAYRRPAAPLPPAYPQAAAGTNRPPPERWWAVFQDEELQSLLARAVAGNRDLKQAILRIRQARAERAVAASGLLPEGGLSGGYDRARGSENVVLPLGGNSGGASGPSAGGSSSAGASSGGGRQSAQVSEGGSAGGGSGAAPVGGPASPFGEGGLPGVTTSLYQAGFDASWEADIFGGTRRAVEAADAAVQAAEEDRRSVLISLLAETAANYVDLRAVQQRLDLDRQAWRAQRALLSLIQGQFRAGLAPELDVTRQAAQADQTAAELPSLEAAEIADEHGLDFILGLDPGALADELGARRGWAELPPEVPAGVPSDLLRRRPDVRAAERRLAAATAEVGVATAALFPHFGLTGSFGLDSSEFRQLPNWSSRYYSIAPGINWPVLEWSKLRAQIRVENALQAQAVLAYQTAVAGALREVEDALVRYEKEKARHAALADAARQAARAHQLADAAYRHGLADELSVLQAEQTRLQAAASLADGDAALRSDLIALYKALGGGWDQLP